MTKSISVRTRSVNEFVDITRQVQQAVTESGVKNGLCCIYVPHTTAGVTINEGADPSVVKDIIKATAELVPRNAGYLHMEGNSDSHIKTAMVGTSQTVIIENGSLLLGAWQAIFFCEFDGGRNRKVHIKIIEG
jgi:secondary thiamine-phosphate synthase enzyme